MDLVTAPQQQQLTTQESSEWTDEQQVLLGQKNILSEEVLRKYNLAGQLAQTGLAYVESLLLESLNEDYDANSNSGMTVGEISRAGTRFLQGLVQGISNIQEKNANEERGLAHPVRIEKMGFVDGVAPEHGESFQGGYLSNEDIVKIVLGVHIDGYIAEVAHTVIVKDFAKHKAAQSNGGKAEEVPVEGRPADAVCAAYLASEAVIALLGLSVSENTNDVSALLGGAGQVSGRHIRKLVESIARAFRVQVVPGSRVRRIRRFLAGQDNIVVEQNLDRKCVEWDEENQEVEQELEISTAAASAVTDKSEEQKSIASKYQEFVESRDMADDGVRVLPGEVWIVDIQMCGGPQSPRGRIVRRTFQGYDESGIHPTPTIYSRDVSVKYDLRMVNARSLLSQVSSKASVFPFTLSQVTLSTATSAAAEGSSKSIPVELRAARLGVKELVNHHMFVPHPITVAVWEPATSTGPVTSKGTKNDSLPVAREMSTVVLVPASLHPEGYGEVLRLTGGSVTGQPAYVHSKYQIEDADILKLLELVQDNRFGIRVRTVQPASEKEALAVVSAANAQADDAMES